MWSDRCCYVVIVLLYVLCCAEHVIGGAMHSQLHLARVRLLLKHPPFHMKGPSTAHILKAHPASDATAKNTLQHGPRTANSRQRQRQ